MFRGVVGVHMLFNECRGVNMAMKVFDGCIKGVNGRVYYERVSRTTVTASAHNHY